MLFRIDAVLPPVLFVPQQSNLCFVGWDYYVQSSILTYVQYCTYGISARVGHRKVIVVRSPSFVTFPPYG
jgi:hypothetical protein